MYGLDVYDEFGLLRARSSTEYLLASIFVHSLALEN